jgi:hypothetical protein
VRFVGLAYGPLLEIETQIELADRLGLSEEERVKDLLELSGLASSSSPTNAAGAAPRRRVPELADGPVTTSAHR